MPDPRKPSSLAFAHNKAVLRARDFAAQGIASTHLSRQVAKGNLVKIGRGLYTTPGQELVAEQSLLEVCIKIPNGVLCLLSALHLHRLTSQLPHEVWIAIPDKQKPPKFSYPPLNIIYASGIAWEEGVLAKSIEGVPFNVYSPVKTVIDCFRHRNKVGLDVALEALKEILAQQQATPAELWECAQKCRISSVMRPYLEAFAHG